MHSKSNEILAKIVALLTTDGHLQLDSRRGVFSFYSKQIEEVKQFQQYCKEVFGITGSCHEDRRGNNLRYKLFFSNKKISAYLKQYGVPVGNKTNIPFKVPSWIYKGKSEVKKAYLQSIYDAEGSIFCESSGRWRLTYTMNKNEELITDAMEYFRQIKSMLLEFGVKTSGIRLSAGNKRKDGSLSKTLKIEIRPSHISAFSYNIGFSSIAKAERLEECMKVKAEGGDRTHESSGSISHST